MRRGARFAPRMRVPEGRVERRVRSHLGASTRVTPHTKCRRPMDMSPGPMGSGPRTKNFPAINTVFLRQPVPAGVNFNRNTASCNPVSAPAVRLRPPYNQRWPAQAAHISAAVLAAAISVRQLDCSSRGADRLRRTVLVVHARARASRRTRYQRRSSSGADLAARPGDQLFAEYLQSDLFPGEQLPPAFRDYLRRNSRAAASTW